MMSQRLEGEIQDRLQTKSLRRVDGAQSGGCISKGYCYVIDNDEKIFVKINASKEGSVMFHGELESIKQIAATSAIRVPKPYMVIDNYDGTQASSIVMEFLDITNLTDIAAVMLGHNLARLHDYNNKVIRYTERANGWVGRRAPSAKSAQQLDEKEDDGEESDDEEDVNPYAKHSLPPKTKATKGSSQSEEAQYAQRFIPEPDTKPVRQFGFDVPTCCGSIPQVNEWTDDWPSFYARYRLDKPIRSLLSDHGDRDLHEEWSKLQLKVDKFFTDYNIRGNDTIIPALLHGDLWSGNVAQLNDNSEAVVYDPSSFYGHAEYDLGIARMFAGFPQSFEKAYFELMPKRKLFESRNKLYQLFHHLNHWDHFGSGYRASSLRIIKDLNSMV